MTKEIKKELNQATRLYRAKKREDAFEIYHRIFLENPEMFGYWDKIRYCWTLYYLHIRDSFDEEELEEYVEMVTEIVDQEDINEAPVCVYTQSVFKILVFYKKNGDWDLVSYWLSKLDPEFLNDKKGSSGEIMYPSKKEEYYNYMSKALLECGEFNECIQVSKKALETFSEFALNGDVWHKFRIAKSLKELGNYDEDLTYLEEVIIAQEHWFVYKEFAENYFNMEDYDSALKYAGKGVLAEGSVNSKVNLFYLIYDLLKDSNPAFALKHAELFLALKLETEGEIPDNIVELEINEDSLDIDGLEQEIKNRWIELEFAQI